MKLIKSIVVFSFIFYCISLSSIDTITLQILNTTDTHGRFMPYDYETNKPDYSGSLAQIATEIDKLREKYPDNTIVVDNGDIIQENLQNIFVNDSIDPMILAMNKIGYNLINLGNHEFNYGIPTLLHVMSQFKSVDGKPNSILCGNVYDKDGKHLFAPYKIVTTNGGIRVGFIGMVTPNIVRWDGPNLKGYKVTDPVDETKKAIKEIKDKVDLLVAIDHMAEYEEYGTKGSSVLDLAKACPELDIIISGHSHLNIPGDYYYKGKIYPQDKADNNVKKNGILINQAGSHGQELGQILVTFTEVHDECFIADKSSDMRSDLIPMEYKKDGKMDHVKPDPELVKQLEPYNQKAIKYASQVIGELTGDKPLAPENQIKGIPQRFLEPTAMMQLINEVVLYYSNKAEKPKKVKVAASAYLNPEGNIYPGNIYRSDMSLIYKYPNIINILKINGTQLKCFMEYCASFFNQYKTGDLTVSFNPGMMFYLFCNFAGVTYDINISKPAGNRIENLKWPDGSPVKDEDEFLMATNNYISGSQLLKPGSVFKDGDKLPVLVDDSVTVNGNSNIQVLIADYIKNVKNGKIKAECSPNWKITGNNWNKKDHDLAVKLINEGKIDFNGYQGRNLDSHSITIEDLNKALKDK